MISENDILKSLSAIVDPDFQKDIVSLGFVRNIRVEGAEVFFEIHLTTPACPVKDEFRQQAETIVSRLPGVSAVHVTMTAPRPEQDQPEFSGDELSNIQSIIAVSSCKGGVGKSTLAAHMALELAQRGFRVGLLDADIYGPSLPHLFNLTNTELKTNKDHKIIPPEVQGLKVMSFGFLLGDSPAVMRGPIVTRYIQQIFLGTEWGKLDYLFVDMPPGTGDIHLTISQSVRLSGTVIVTTPHGLSLVDVARGILMFEKVNVPVLGVVGNMTHFEDPDSGKKHHLFGQASIGQLRDRFGLDIIGEIPVLTHLTEPLSLYTANSYIMDIVDKTIRALGKSTLGRGNLPQIQADETHLTLTWVDGRVDRVSHFTLRLNSRDAYSVDEITGERKIQPEDIPRDIRPEKIMPLGNYALGIEWTDGHKSGIYPYTLIRDLDETVQGQKTTIEMKEPQ